MHRYTRIRSSTLPMFLRDAQISSDYFIFFSCTIVNICCRNMETLRLPIKREEYTDTDGTKNMECNFQLLLYNKKSA